MGQQQKTIALNIKDQNIFFTSDLHFSHANIIKYCDRPFYSAGEMDAAMIANWNNVVGEEDIVFILGDFCFGSTQTWLHFLRRLNGKKYLTQGNHDKGIPVTELVFVYPLMNLWIKGDDEISDGQRITCCHYPMLSWYQSHRGSWQLYGHVHGRLSNKNVKESSITPNQLDVGVDVHNFTPISYEQVKTIITKQNLNK